MLGQRRRRREEEEEKKRKQKQQEEEQKEGSSGEAGTDDSKEGEGEEGEEEGPEEEIMNFPKFKKETQLVQSILTFQGTPYMIEINTAAQRLIQVFGSMCPEALKTQKEFDTRSKEIEEPSG